MKNRIICCILCTICCLFLYPSNCFAADGYGFAIYHAKAFLITHEWHGGMMRLGELTSTNAIIHEGDPDSPENPPRNGVHYCSLNSFLNGQAFRGYYRPKDGITTAQRYLVINTANKLTQYNISYALAHQMNYTRTLTTAKIQPSEITKIRCDGVVEYSYEFRNFHIYGNNSGWDISDPNTPLSVHSAANISPKKQAEYYMTNMLGDIDADCEVTVDDAQIALQYSVGLETPANSYQSFVADVDGDGDIDIDDSRLILRYAVGLETVFPADPINDLSL